MLEPQPSSTNEVRVSSLALRHRNAGRTSAVAHRRIIGGGRFQRPCRSNHTELRLLASAPEFPAVQVKERGEAWPSPFVDVPRTVCPSGHSLFLAALWERAVLRFVSV